MATILARSREGKTPPHCKVDESINRAGTFTTDTPLGKGEEDGEEAEGEVYVGERKKRSLYPLYTCARVAGNKGEAG